jgi:hypothetical protein
MQYDPKQVFTSPAGPASFPFLTKPRQFQNRGAFAYDTGLILSDAAFTKEGLRGIDMPFRDAIEAWGALSVERSRFEPRPLPYGPLLERDGDGNRLPVEGFHVVRFKVDAETTTKKGDVWDRKPKLFDKDGHPMPVGTAVAPGTIIRIKFTVWLTSGGDKAGVKLQPVAVQIVRAVENAETFERYDDGSVDDGSTFEPSGESSTSGDF